MHDSARYKPLGVLKISTTSHEVCRVCLSRIGFRNVTREKDRQHGSVDLVSHVPCLTQWSSRTLQAEILIFRAFCGPVLVNAIMPAHTAVCQSVSAFIRIL